MIEQEAWFDIRLSNCEFILKVKGFAGGVNMLFLISRYKCNKILFQCKL
jgi:hypothetical protein